MNSHNQIALNYWKVSTYTEQQVKTTFERLSDRPVLKLNFIHGELTTHATERASEHGRLDNMKTFLKNLSLKNPNLNGSLLFDMGDGLGVSRLSAPILAFSKRYDLRQVVLIPDYGFIITNGRQHKRQRLNPKINSLPWEMRKPTAFWRGSSTGGLLHTENWKKNRRIQLSCYAKECGDPALIDASITKITPLKNPEHKQRILDLGIVSERVEFEDFLNFKYLIDIDGNTCAWESLFLKLYSGSVVFKVQSDNVQWYYHKLIPWQHYIPVATDLSDLKERILWAREHDEVCQQIAKAGREFVLQELVNLDPVDFVAGLVRQVLACQVSE